MNKIMKGFLWTGTEVVQGGKCCVAWSRVQRPLELGILGVMDLQLFRRALHMRSGYGCNIPTWRAPGLSLPLKVDETTSAFFKASTRPMLGDGKTLMFWSGSYLDGHYITEIAPQLVAAVPCRCLRRRTVATMLVHHDWVRDTIGALTIPVLVQFLQLRQRLDEVVLQHDPRPDRLVWKWSASGTFSTSSAYKAVSGASGHSSRQGSP
jgi:hypothetical protein